MSEEPAIKAVEEIASQLGEKYVLIEDLDRSAYSYDASGMRHVPSAVVRPTETEDISFIIEVANRYGVPLVPRGSGTSLVGGPLPIEGGIVVDMQMMNKIIDKDDYTGLVRAETGLRVYDLNNILPGRFMPINPDGTGFSTIGGLIAEDAASPLSVKYSTMAAMVLGLEVVLPTGEALLVEQPGPPSKRNILDLLIGSEGTLGIFTSALLKLPLKPKHRVAYRIEMIDISDAISIQTAVKREEISIAGFEAYHNYKELIGEGGAEAISFLEISGTEECVDVWGSKLRSIFKELDIPFEEISINEADDIWIRRKSIYELAKRREVAMRVVSLQVHTHLTRDAIQEVDRTGSRLKLPVVTVFNPLLGWVMAIFLYDPTDEREIERTDKAASNVIDRAIALGGSIGFGVGAGITKITSDMDEGFVSTFSKVKEAVDPNWIMNPGKLIER